MKKICVMHQASIGDTLMATPVYRAIKESYPNCELVVVTSPLGEELLSGNPHIDKLIKYQKGDPILPVVKSLWRADVAVVFDYHYRNAFYAFLALIPKRIGYGKDFINVRMEDEPLEMFEPLKYLAMVKQLGVETKDLKLTRPVATEEEKARIKAICEEIKTPEQKLILIVPFSLSPAKDWGIEKYQEIIRRLKDLGHVVAMTGGSEQTELINKEFPDVVNLAGQTNLRESAELIAQADLLICGCTAMLHVCSTTDTPSVAIYGPTLPEQWAPRENCKVITHRFPCSPCYNIEGRQPCKDNTCLKDITVEEVWEATEELLSGKKPDSFKPAVNEEQNFREGKKSMRPNSVYDDIMYKVMLLCTFVVNLSTALTSCAVGLGAAVILFRAFKNRELPQIDRKIGGVFLIYFILQFIIAAASFLPLISLREVVGEIHRCFPLFFAMLYIKKREQLRGILIAFTASVLINNFYGLYQYFILELPRAYAFCRTPTFYSSFLLMQMPVLLLITTLKFMPHWSKILAAGAGIFSVLMLILTVTRGAWLAFLVTCIVFMIIAAEWRKRIAKVLVSTALIFMIAISMSPQLRERAASIVDWEFQSNSERLLMWESSINIIKNFPLVGIGQEVFVYAYNQFFILPEAKERADDPLKGHTHPHNNILKVTSEGGAIGFMAFMILHGYFFYRLYKLYESERGKMELSYGLTGLLILTALQLEGITDTNMNQVPIMREYWLLIGMFLIASKVTKV